jgi:VWFA-related protein
VVRRAARLLTLGILALAPAVAAPGQRRDQQPPVFRAESELVRLDVVVLDADGRPVTGLERDDFTVEEDGRPQVVESFEPVVMQARPAVEPEAPRLSFGRIRPPSEGRSFFVFFDSTHVTASASEAVRVSLRRFVATELREGDWFTVTAPEQGIWWTARSAWEYEQLAAVIGRLQGEYVRDPLRVGMSDWRAMAIVEGLAGPWGEAMTSPIGAAPGAAPGSTPGAGDGGTAPAGGGSGAGGGASGSGGSTSSGREEAAANADARMGVGVANPEFLAQEVYASARRRIAITLAGLRQALESLVSVRGHKALLLVSEGFLLVPGMPGYEELIDEARRANVAVYAIDPRGFASGFEAEARGAPGPGWGVRRAVEAAGTDDLAVATGGRSVASNDPGEGLRRIAVESEAYYLLGYQPEKGKRGERKVKVRVKGPGMRVRARTRYFAGTPEEPALPKVKDETPGKSPADREAMRAVADTTDLPLRLATFFFEDNGKGQVTTMYATEIRMAVEAAGRRRFVTVAEARSRDGGQALRDEFDEDLRVAPGVPTILSRHWHMPPGVWQARVLVRDRKTGRIGTALHTFEVPPPDAFRLSTPILTSELEEVDGRPRPRIVLNRTFRAGGALYCQFQVHGAARDRGDRLPHVRAGYALRRGEDVVRSAEPTRIKPEWDGRLSRLMGLPLEGMASGRYTLVLTVEDELSAKRLEVAEPFTVAP